MKSERSLVRGVVVFAACSLVLVVLFTAKTPVTGSPVEFTLATSKGEPGPVSFTLAPRSGEPTALAGPGGLGVIEDSGPPYRTAVGYNALFSLTTGQYNTAFGYNALSLCFDGNNNTAVGYRALAVNAFEGNTAIGALSMGGYAGAGSFNTAIGASTLYETYGDRNTATGAEALRHIEWGSDNTALGYNALHRTGNTSPPAMANTAVGSGALEALGFSYLPPAPPATGTGQDRNLALGYKAGSALEEGSDNIYVGANQVGVPSENNTMRLGLTYSPSGGQNRTFIAGIVETPLTSGDGPSVVGITSEGRLGTMSSDILPPGPQGPQGIQGPAGEGLVPGSLLFLPSGIAPPAGYAFLGITELAVIDPVAKKASRLKINIYQKL